MFLQFAKVFIYFLFLSIKTCVFEPIFTSLAWCAEFRSLGATFLVEIILDAADICLSSHIGQFSQHASCTPCEASFMLLS